MKHGYLELDRHLNQEDLKLFSILKRKFKAQFYTNYEEFDKILVPIAEYLISFGLPSKQYSDQPDWELFRSNLKITEFNSEQIAIVTKNLVRASLKYEMKHMNNENVPIPNNYIESLSTFLQNHSFDEISQTVRKTWRFHSIIHQPIIYEHNGLTSTDRMTGIPTFWDHKHYQFFLQALYKYGFESFEDLLIDPEFPFHEKLTQSSKEQIEKGNRGFEIPEFDFILTKFQRIKIADYVSVMIYTIEELKYYEKTVKKKDRFLREYFVYEPYNRLKVVCFGKIVENPRFQGKACKYPVGYISHRKMTLKRSNIWFRFEVLSVCEIPVFYITAIHPLKGSHIGLSAQKVWETAIRSNDSNYLNEYKVSAAWLSGLANKHVLNQNFKNV